MIRINNLQKNFGTKKAVDIENYTIGQGDMLVDCLEFTEKL